MEEPRHVLVGTRLSPPLEAMRWLFERQRFAYEERAHLPGFHVPASKLAGVPVELPLLRTPEGPIGGARASFRYFEDLCRPGERPFGETDEDRRRAWELIDSLCERLFLPAVRLYYGHMLPDGDIALRFAGAGAPAWESALARRFYKTWSGALRRGLALDAHDAARSKASVEAAFAAATAELKGRPFIGGDAPNGVDIVFAALAAPVILPERYGAPAPTISDVPADFARLVEELRGTSGGALALRVYEQRTPPQPPQKVPSARPTLLARLATPRLLRGGARLVARFGPRSLRVRGATLVFRWADVSRILKHDGDFVIAPINAARIEAVSGPFILGMDRSEALFEQRRVVYSALRATDPAPIVATLRSEPERLLEAARRREGRIDIVNGYARPVAARVAAALFGIGEPTEADLMRVARAVFEETFLNLGGDAQVKARGVAAGRELLGWIEAEAASRRGDGRLGGDLLGRLLELERGGTLAPAGVGPALAGLLVGSIDTTATAVANIVAEMLADKALGAAVARDVDNRERLWGWCLEALRRRPHNPILLRQALAGAAAAGRPVAAGERVVAVTLSAMQDPRVFDAPATMNPARPRELYMHFGHGMHLCSGRDLNAVQIPALIGALARFRPSGRPNIRNRGPFPDQLVVSLEGPQ